MSRNDDLATIEAQAKKIRGLENDILRVGQVNLIAEILVTLQYLKDKIENGGEFQTNLLNEINGLIFKIHEKGVKSP